MFDKIIFVTVVSIVGLTSCRQRSSSIDEQTVQIKDSVGWRFNGILLEVDSLERYAIVMQPFDQEDGEYRLGRMVLLDLQSRESIEMVDSILVDASSAKFLTERHIAISTFINLFIYDIMAKETSTSLVEPLTSEQIVGFAKLIGGKYALVVKDYERNTVKLKILNARLREESYVELPFESSEVDEPLSIPVFSKDSTIVFAFMGKVITYRIGSRRLQVVSDKLAYNDGDLIGREVDRLVYFEFGPDRRYVLNEFDFQSGKSSTIKSDDPSLSHDQRERVSLTTRVVKGENRVFLSVGSVSYAFRTERWIPIDEVPLYNGHHIRINSVNDSADVFELIIKD